MASRWTRDGYDGFSFVSIQVAVKHNSVSDTEVKDIAVITLAMASMLLATVWLLSFDVTNRIESPIVRFSLTLHHKSLQSSVPTNADIRDITLGHIFTYVVVPPKTWKQTFMQTVSGISKLIPYFSGDLEYIRFSDNCSLNLFTGTHIMKFRWVPDNLVLILLYFSRANNT